MSAAVCCASTATETRVTAVAGAVPVPPRRARFAGLHCGIKRRRPDLGLLLIEGPEPAAAAAVFTQNRLQAAPVVVSREHLRATRGRVRAVIVNSGNANCATGPEGLRAARAMARAVARAIGCESEQVLVCSTGVIGVPLPVERIETAVPALLAAADTASRSLEQFATAILTTDTRVKLAAASFRAGRRSFQIVGCAKGSGMIHPRLATMLAFLVTDARLRPPVLQKALRAAVAETFNAISVDGDTSTNDTVVLLATGTAEEPAIEPGTAAYRKFLQALQRVCRELAVAIVADGEGARHVLQIEVCGCSSQAAARRIAETIATSPLVKTALAGGDPNWGRVLAAAGRSGVAFDPARARLWLADTLVFQRGRPVAFDEQAVSQKMRQPVVSLRLHAGHGTARARMYTCDLTADYVDINASYRT
jgi:glutamate N-acetyltransferase/amino-acid N-acetyltransferase